MKTHLQKLFLLLFLSLQFNVTNAQYYANSVYGYSSQYSGLISIAGGHAASKVLGAPDVGGYYSHPDAWAPDTENSGYEWIVVEYSNAAYTNGCIVYETYNNGCIYKIKSIDENGVARTEWEKTSYSGTPIVGSGGVSQAATGTQFSWPTTTYKVKKLELYLNTSWVSGYNEIDAIGMYWVYASYGCTDPLATNYDSYAFLDDGSCTYPPGCTDSTAFNYSPNATIDDGSCIPVVNGCIDSTMFNYNVNANTDDGSCIAIAYGCTDIMMPNYDANANTDDGTCATIFDQYAASVVGFSSEYQGYTNGNFRAIQTLGAPNVPSYSDHPNAWVPSTTNSGYEWINVEYTLPVFSNGCIITESYGNGTIFKIVSVDEDGNYRLEWYKDTYSGAPATGTGGVSQTGVISQTQFGWATTTYRVKRLEIYLNTSWVSGWNEIDAIELLGVALALGCTDSSAFNYNANANSDDGSCNYTHTVTNTNDTGNGSLRDVINSAYDGDSIIFSPSINGQIITLNSEIDIDNKDLTIVGNGVSNTILSGGNLNRVFDIYSGSNIELLHLTVQEGSSPNWNGGGIWLGNSTLTISYCSVEQNNGENGGAIWASSSTIKIHYSTMNNNNATSSGGVIYATSNVAVEIKSSTITANTSPSGSAIHISSSNSNSLSLYNSTIHGNTTTNISGTSTIDAGSASVISTGSIISESNQSYDIDGTNFTSNGYNFTRGTSTGGTVTTDITGIDPMLGPLQDNGGYTKTMLPLYNSPAFDAGDPNDNTSPQNGVVLVGLRDIGAAEAPITSYMVVNTNDSGSGSLRYAIENVGSGDTVFFSSNINGQTIFLNSGIDIDGKTLVIQGNDTTNTIISGLDSSRIFDINNGSDVKIRNVKMQNAHAIGNGGAIWIGNSTVVISKTCITDCEVGAPNNNTVVNQGAAIYVNNSNLTIKNTTIRDNWNRHAGSNGFGTGGGAIFATNATTFNMSNCVLKNNLSYHGKGGGALYFDGIDFMIDSTSFINNSVSNFAYSNNAAPAGGGGAIYSMGTDSGTINNSLFQGNNSGDEGGAIYIGAYGHFSNNYAIAINKSTFVSNSAYLKGGAVSLGQLLGNNDLKLYINECTFTHNSSIQDGTAIKIDGGDYGLAKVYVNNSTITSNIYYNNSNSAVLLAQNCWSYFSSTILSGNSIDLERNHTSAFIDLGNNVFGYGLYINGSVTTNIYVQPPSIQSTNPMLDSLAYNGGFTPTRMPQFGSPAVNNGSSSTVVPQNGVAIVGVRDIGACESIHLGGCMDSTAFNFNPNATFNDSSCIPTVYGCMDSLACNYDSLANTDDNSCLLAGCTDTNAINYNALASCDDGSCITVYGCTDSTATNYNPGALTNDGSCCFIQTSQVGNDVDGEAVGDQSGYSVSLSADGNIMAVSGISNDGNGNNSGHVRIYSWNGSSWVQMGNDIDGETADDQSGYSVSISADGETVAIGTPKNDDAGNNAGQAEIYSWNGSSWVQMGSDINGSGSSSDFGSAVTLSADGETVAVGAPGWWSYANQYGGANTGYVGIYSWDGYSWGSIGYINGESSWDYSGCSVSLSAGGDTVAIGAWDAYNTNSAEAGHVRIFYRSGSSWYQIGSDIDGESYQDKSGTSVSLSADGTRVAIGAPGNHGNGYKSGHVRVYSLNNSSWVQMGNDIDGEAANDESGTYVSLSADGTTLAIGAPYNDGNGSNSGHARVYSWDGASWNQIYVDIDGEAANDESGISVSLSADGKEVAVGAHTNGGVNGTNSGHVRVYKVFNTCGGCIDPLADNYDSTATIADGSCLYYGCTDTLAVNYSSAANADDGSCIVYGCTDSTMFNYYSGATIDNGSCIAYVYGCMDTLYQEYDSLTNTANGSCKVLVVTNINDAGLRSLRGMVNHASDGDSIIFSPAINGQIITLNSEIDIDDKDLKIVGNGAANTIVSGGNSNRIFDIYSGSNIQLHHLTIQEAYVAGNGGGIWLGGSSLDIYFCDFENNESWYGGAMWASSSTINIYYSTLDSNNGTGNGGAIYLSSSVSCTITNSTLAANTSPIGGAVFMDGSSHNLVLNNSTIYGNITTNSSGTSTIHSGSSSITSVGSVIFEAGKLYDVYGTNFTSNGYNFTRGTSTGQTVATDIVGTDPMLGLLQNNGGYTKTLLPLYGSPLIDAGDPNDTTMPQNQVALVDTRDIGATESSYIPGCMDSSMFNYNVNANVDDSTCIAIIHGCIDSTAFNYNANANTDDGSCIIYGCTDSTAFNYDVNANINDSSCVAVVNGCTDSTAFNYNANANTDDGSCIAVVNGCIDSTAFNYNANANTDDGSCVAVVNGCIDSTAFNYNANANTDDGSCIAVVNGCTDSTAFNYNINANTNDGSCLYCDLSAESFIVQNSSSTDCDGAIFSLVTSSYGPISYSWNTGQLSFFITGLCADTYVLTATDSVGCSINDTVVISSILISGCTDSLATNYDPTATVDDGSCQYPSTCTNPSPTGAYVSELIHDRARINWDNMNSSTCMVDQYRIRYREQGTSSWSSKTMAGSGLCIFGLNTTSKKILGLSPSTTYEYYMKAWYCGGGVSSWSAIQTFTTADACPNVINFAASSPTTTKATFTWDTTAAYSFVRIKLRVDTTGAAWTTAGGFGVFYPTLTKNKNGLTPGQPYRASARTWCDPNGGTYRSAGWTSPIFWTQPTSIRVEGGTAINNLDVYPNPSRDIFNVSFTSEDVQDLEVRVINVVGEVVYTENLEEFVGEYTKQVDLATYTKGVYFLEIKTEEGTVYKKLALQ